LRTRSARPDGSREERRSENDNSAHDSVRHLPE
jgi:hypothetical protein